MSEQQSGNGGFAKAFVPGLGLGLVIGAFVGATLPPILSGKKLPAPNPNAVSGPREREEFPAPAEDPAAEAPGEDGVPAGEEPVEEQPEQPPPGGAGEGSEGGGDDGGGEDSGGTGGGGGSGAEASGLGWSGGVARAGLPRLSRVRAGQSRHLATDIYH